MQALLLVIPQLKLQHSTTCPLSTLGIDEEQELRNRSQIFPFLLIGNIGYKSFFY